MLRQRYAAALMLGLLAGSATLPAFAQNAAPAANAPAAPATPAQPNPSPEQLASAVEFLQASGLTRGFDDMIPQFLQQANAVYANQRPELSSMINEVTLQLVPEFVKQRGDLDQSLAKLYTVKFTEDELKQLTAFYRSPVGQKFSNLQQDIVRDSYPIVQAWTRTLQENIAKRIKEEVEKRGQKL